MPSLPRTHRFSGGMYEVHWGRIDGLCELPGQRKALYLVVGDDVGFRAFHTALHEAEHADGIPIKYTDGDTGDSTRRRATFLWRVAQALLSGKGNRMSKKKTSTVEKKSAVVQKAKRGKTLGEFLA